MTVHRMAAWKGPRAKQAPSPRGLRGHCRCRDGCTHEPGSSAGLGCASRATGTRNLTVRPEWAARSSGTDRASGGLSSFHRPFPLGSLELCPVASGEHCRAVSVSGWPGDLQWDCHLCLPLNCGCCPLEGLCVGPGFLKGGLACVHVSVYTHMCTH